MGDRQLADKVRVSGARPQSLEHGSPSMTASALHFILSTIGSAGDVNPFAAIGRELR